MYSRPGCSHVVGSRKAELNWKGSYFSLPSYIIHVIPESRNAGWGVWSGIRGIYPQVRQHRVTAWLIPWDLWGARVMHLRTAHPGDKRGTHLFMGSCSPLVKGSPGELTPLPASKWCMCESPKSSAVLQAMVSEKCGGRRQDVGGLGWVTPSFGF